MEWMILPFKRYFDFKGRSRRKELWMYTLFVIMVSIVLMFLDSALGLGGSTTGDTELTDTSMAAAGAASGGWLTTIFSLATLIPSIAVSVRRLHDLDRTGWWILLPVAPYLLGVVLAIGGIAAGGGAMAGVGLVLFGVALITAILLLVWYCMPGTAGPNRFGEDPKGEGTNAEEVFG